MIKVKSTLDIVKFITTKCGSTGFDKIGEIHVSDGEMGYIKVETPDGEYMVRAEELEAAIKNAKNIAY